MCIDVDIIHIMALASNGGREEIFVMEPAKVGIRMDGIGTLRGRWRDLRCGGASAKRRIGNTRTQREPSDCVQRASTPLELVTTDIGAEKVTNMLYQLEYGIYA